MIYRIAMSILVVAALLAVAYITESGDTPNTPAPTTSGSADDAAMKSLKIE